MKTLTKIKLINWHGFYDEEISIAGSILITGENGSGKSTVIDAMYFLLTGGETNRFNAAANEDATRSIETYMRGKIGVEGKEFLRPESSVISHIALEFQDTDTKKYFVLGVVLEIQEGKNKVGKSFYHIKDRRLNGEDYYLLNEENKKSYVNFKVMRKNLGSLLNSLEGGKNDIRSALYAVLALENRKYYELLPKAIAFKPIPDVNSFVYQFLMPQNDVEIDNIKKNIHTYNELQKRIKEDEDKAVILSRLTSYGDDYQIKLREKSLLEAYKIKKDLDYYGNQTESLGSKITIANKLIVEQEQNKENLKKESDGLIGKIINIENSNAYIVLRDTEKELKIKKELLIDAETKESELNKAILNEDSFNKKLKIEINLQKYIRNKNFAEFLESLNKAHIEWIEARHKLSDTIYKTTSEEIKLTKEVAQNKKDLDELRKGALLLPEGVNNLIEVIKKGIREQKNSDITVRPLCELIDIKESEEEWRNAAEGYLNTRRFDLFVAPEYYDLALRLYEKQKYEKKIYGVGLVNTAKLKSELPQVNSLATKLVTDDEDAKKYIDYLLGRIICVNSEDELKEFESAITKTVMVYQNKAARQTRIDVYRTPFIGRASRLIRIEQIEKQIREFSLKLEEVTNRLRTLEVLNRSTSDTNYSYLNKCENSWKKVDELKIKLESLAQQLETLEKQAGKIIFEKKEFEEEKAQIDIRIKKIDYEIQTLVSQRDRNVERKGEYEKKSESLMPEFIQIIKKENIESQIDEYINNNPLTNEQIATKLKDNNDSVRRLNDNILKGMVEYITKHGFDAVATIESLEAFYKEYNTVVKRALEKYISQVEKVKADAVKTFQNEYISKIRRFIQNEKNNIKNLNKVLSDKPFGSDGEIYQFEITKSKDSRFGNFYEIFMSNEDYQNNNVDLFTDNLSDAHLSLLQELFHRLTEEGKTDSQQEKLVKEYTDYRKFMNYDIIITNKNGEKIRFSQNNKEKSGGETQTPFYVIIAASFDQIIHGSYGPKSPGCIVMFDEAFNNMDESRIDSMMKYFQKLDIQPIIAVPSQRAKTILPFITTTIGLVKVRNRIKARVLIKEAE